MAASRGSHFGILAFHTGCSLLEFEVLLKHLLSATGFSGRFAHRLRRLALSSSLLYHLVEPFVGVVVAILHNILDGLEVDLFVQVFEGDDLFAIASPILQGT